MEETKIAAAIQALTTEQQQTAFRCGERIAKNELETLEVASDYAAMLGTEPTFDQWENGRVKWIEGHVKANPKLTGNAHDAAWGMFASKLNMLFGLTKPSSKSAAAEKKAAERAAKQQALLEQHKAASPDALRQQLEKAHLALAKNPSNKAAEKQVRELKAVLKVKTAAESKAESETLAAIRKEINQAAKQCTHKQSLEAARDILTEAVDFEYSDGPANQELSSEESLH